MDILRAAETVGGGASPADLLLLTSGALAERNVNAAAGEGWLGGREGGAVLWCGVCVCV